jgi:hypothetical protein
MCAAYMTCAERGFNCGTAPDGCGNNLDCGTCPSGQLCGVATLNVCSVVCTPKSCLQQGLDCGQATDTCGTPLDCGTCTTGQTCGASTPNVCGVVCNPVSCASQGWDCGSPGDGCGHTLDCGTCPTGQVCGIATANVCSVVCTPKSCLQQGLDCGAATDTCGTPLNCGSCPTGDSCNNNVCMACGSTGTVIGTVYAPNGVDPLAGVTVYVPGAAVTAFAPGISCETCTQSLKGSPVTKTVTLANGTFSLPNVPAGTNVPLVIQKGHWRRQFVIPSVAGCTNTQLPTSGGSQIRMPRTSTVHAGGEGDIPLMAFVTGAVDALECLLRKIGIADTEFSDPSGTGRVRMYLGSGSPGAAYSTSTPSETTLWATPAAIDSYDMVYFACQGDDYEKTAAQQQIVVNYANAGGRVLATHYSYVWITNDTDNATWSTTASWVPGLPTGEGVFSTDPLVGTLNQSFPRGALLAQWLQAIGATTTLGQVQVGTLRNDFLGVLGASSSWLTVTDFTLGTVPLHYTFDTPVGAAPANQCGRVLYSDFHAEDATTTGSTFPAECTTTGMTAQEKMVEHMLFDLDDCLGP